ncbi:DUF6603 domain-containing protein [Streptomyces sp. NPDC017988]|uniref:DUF6603 domain-containing protein n=1 Tax=Streptomyces sp. NPDC017988 TaxID=3365025 RepID=UPI0037B52407
MGDAVAPDADQQTGGDDSIILTGGALLLELPKDKGSKATLASGLSSAGAGRHFVVRVASAPVGAGGGRVTALVAQVEVKAGLTDLPVVGALLPAGTGRVHAGALLLRTQAAPADQAKAQRLVDLLTTAAEGGLVPKLGPRTVLTERAAAGLKLELLPGRPLEVWSGAGSTSRQGALVLPAAETGAGADGQVGEWVALDKALGPLRLRRAGLMLRGKQLWLLLDAGLDFTALKVQVVGLGLGVTLDGSHRVEGTLDGLGLDYRAGPVTVAGALVRLRPPPSGTRLAIAGLLTVDTSQIAFSAAGMYAELTDGRASVFVIGQVSGLRIPLGPVLLTGLVGGFGYNSQLVLPRTPEQVPAHPLVAGVSDPSVLELEGGPLKVLQKLGDTVRPASGVLWGAAGVELSLFKAVDAKLVVAVQATANDVTVALLGTATAVFPPKKPYARVALGLQAVYRSSTGEIAVRGAIDAARSFLVHQDCRLQGGFALCTWVPPSPHRGDFVASVGGYHPAYRRPEHYPAVDRVGIRWEIGGTLRVTGECYAALTPSMLMAGGRLAVRYTSSRVRAWLDAHLDVAVQWQPFAFEVSLGLRVGVEISFAGTHHLELAVDLELWGTPTGGLAHLHLPYVPDVVIRFGEPRPTEPKKVGWNTFHDQVLGGQRPQLLITGGLLAEQKLAKGRQPEVARVSIGTFTFLLSTPLPCPVVYGATSADGKEKLAGSAGTVTVRPMDQDGITADAFLRLTSGPANSPVYHSLAKWRLTEERAAVPASAFGPRLLGGAPDPRGGAELLSDRLVGVRLTAPAATREEPLGPMAKTRLDLDAGPGGRHPLPRIRAGTAPWEADRDEIARTLPARSSERDAVHRAWRHLAPAQEPTALWDLADRLYTALRTDPLTVGPGAVRV